MLSNAPVVVSYLNRQNLGSQFRPWNPRAGLRVDGIRWGRHESLVRQSSAMLRLLRRGQNGDPLDVITPPNIAISWSCWASTHPTGSLIFVRAYDDGRGSRWLPNFGTIESTNQIIFAVQMLVLGNSNRLFDCLSSFCTYTKYVLILYIYYDDYIILYYIILYYIIYISLSLSVFGLYTIRVWPYPSKFSDGKALGAVRTAGIWDHFARSAR